MKAWEKRWREVSTLASHYCENAEDPGKPEPRIAEKADVAECIKAHDKELAEKIGRIFDSAIAEQYTLHLTKGLVLSIIEGVKP